MTIIVARSIITDATAKTAMTVIEVVTMMEAKIRSRYYVPGVFTLVNSLT